MRELKTERTQMMFFPNGRGEPIYAFQIDGRKGDLQALFSVNAYAASEVHQACSAL